MFGDAVIVLRGETKVFGGNTSIFELHIKEFGGDVKAF